MKIKVATIVVKKILSIKVLRGLVNILIILSI